MFFAEYVNLKAESLVYLHGIGGKTEERSPDGKWLPLHIDSSIEESQMLRPYLCVFNCCVLVELEKGDGVLGSNNFTHLLPRQLIYNLKYQ